MPLFSIVVTIDLDILLSPYEWKTWIVSLPMAIFISTEFASVYNSCVTENVSKVLFCFSLKVFG